MTEIIILMINNHVKTKIYKLRNSDILYEVLFECSIKCVGVRVLVFAHAPVL